MIKMYHPDESGRPFATPLTDIARSAEWSRALCAWTAWLVWVG